MQAGSAPDQTSRQSTGLIGENMKQGMLLAGLLLAAQGAWAQGSPYIQEIEEQLQQLGFDPGPVDGRFDSRLTAAINAFKASRNLPQDGLLDTRTRDLLARAVAPPPAAPPVTLVQPAPPPRVEPAPSKPTSTSIPNSTPSAQAEAATAGVKPAVRHGRVVFGWTAGGGIESGGDRVGKRDFTNGQHKGLPLGDGLVFNAGLRVKPNAQSRWEFRAVGGFKYRGTSDPDSNIHIRRITHELSARVRVAGKFWLGAGAQAHTGIYYEGDNLMPSMRFRTAVGPVAQIGWRGLWLTATKMEYEEVGGGDFDAASIGLFAAFPF